ncbi:MAG: hypothetical protein IKE46_00250 [Selenomonadaceae bacterium]|nr:hypothetical protein [Selenomonadaceae bacterium]
MATREENFKKINAKLEQLSDEQLEQITGGTWGQTADDSEFLHNLADLCEKYTGAELAFTAGSSKEEEVQAAWKACGINFIWHGGAIYDNEYYIGTRKVSRDEAINHAKSIFGK